MTLKVFNTKGRKLEEFTPLSPGQVKMYSCGPTVYDYPHIGNLRAMLFADTLYRWLTYGEGYTASWVMNITDVDDKTIRRSKEDYPDLEPMEALIKYTRKFEAIFFANLQKLNIDTKSFALNPRATEFVPEMQNLIRAIYDQGYAKIQDGSVFFNVSKFAQDHDYGVLLKLDLANLKTGMRTLADETEKDNLEDFALWKGVKEGEPFWEFELDGESLPGRPGWHIECSGMGQKLLDLPFDIHTGGVDLIFPHHENEVAQARAGLGCTTANYWLHNEHFLVDGKKMSKSLGNFYTLDDLLSKGHDADSIRYFIVSNHYRVKFNLTQEAFAAADSALKRLRNALDLLQKCEADPNLPASFAIDSSRERFIQAMQNDLNTSRALAELFELISAFTKAQKINPTEKQEFLDFFRFAQKIFGLRFLPHEQQVPPQVQELAQKRQKARQAKNFEQADHYRDKAKDLGYELRDTATGIDIIPL
jgi:cysteinyl-tRNA synthetase